MGHGVFVSVVLLAPEAEGARSTAVAQEAQGAHSTAAQQDGGVDGGEDTAGRQEAGGLAAKEEQDRGDGVATASALVIPDSGADAAAPGAAEPLDIDNNGASAEAVAACLVSASPAK